MRVTNKFVFFCVCFLFENPPPPLHSPLFVLPKHDEVFQDDSCPGHIMHTIIPCLPFPPVRETHSFTGNDWIRQHHIQMVRARKMARAPNGRQPTSPLNERDGTCQCDVMLIYCEKRLTAAAHTNRQYVIMLTDIYLFVCRPQFKRPKKEG